MEPENQTAVAEATATPEVPPLVLAVGESVTLAASQAGDVLDSEKEIQRGHLMLAARREQYLVEEAQLMNAIQTARRNFETKVKAAGNALGLVFEGDVVYSFDASKRTFTRTK